VRKVDIIVPKARVVSREMVKVPPVRKIENRKVREPRKAREIQE